MEKKTIKKVVAGCLALMCMATAGIMSVVTNGFGYKPTEKSVEAGVSPDTDGAYEAEGNKGIKLMNAVIAAADYDEYGISPMAETAQLLTATINPTNATNKALTWSIAWKDSSSTWASGKNVTDYVTVTPTSSGANTATVECLQAFGEQVIVMVTSEDNADATASCTVDYAKRVSTLQTSFADMITLEEYGQLTLNSDVTLNVSVAAESFIYAPTLTYTAYTVEEDFSQKIEVRVNEEVLTELKAATGLSIIGATYTKEFENDYDHIRDFKFTDRLSGVDWSEADNYNKLSNWLKGNTDKALFTVVFTMEGEYSTCTSESAVYFNADGLEVRVESVSLNQGSLIF